MALLGMLQRTTRRLGIAVPSTIVGNNDTQIVQLLALADEEGEDLASRFRWSTMITENTFTLTTSTRDQGAINSAVVSNGDFDYLVSDTIWNRTTSLPITGALDSVEWQTLQAFPVTGPYQQFQIRSDGHLYIDPAPTSADTAAFDYMSTSWCESSGGTGQSAWAADTDVGRLSENLMTLGIRWRWLKTKGLEYGQDFETYEQRVEDAMARDSGKTVLNLEARDRDYRKAGVVIPIGSWSV